MIRISTYLFVSLALVFMLDTVAYADDTSTESAKPPEAEPAIVLARHHLRYRRGSFRRSYYGRYSRHRGYGYRSHRYGAYRYHSFGHSGFHHGAFGRRSHRASSRRY